MDNKLMPFTWVNVRPGRSTPADLVQSRFTQIIPRSLSARISSNSSQRLPAYIPLLQLTRSLSFLPSLPIFHHLHSVTANKLWECACLPKVFAPMHGRFLETN